MTPTPAQGALLFLVGAAASGINAVAGGGSLISFPSLIGMGLAPRIANATNSVGLFPGSFAGGLGFRNLFGKAGKHMTALLIPTALGSIVGAWLLLQTMDSTFKKVIPGLILLASALLLFQPKVKKLIGHEKTLPLWAGLALQFLVSVYGGYFGAGMGIMMLACFAFYMEGNVSELNAVKNWLALLINFTCSVVFFAERMVDLLPAAWIVGGSLVGGFCAAKISQRFNPDKLRIVIGVYGLAMTAYFAVQAIR